MKNNLRNIPRKMAHFLGGEISRAFCTQFPRAKGERHASWSCAKLGVDFLATASVYAVMHNQDNHVRLQLIGDWASTNTRMSSR
ncbi:MAG: hypothetical protein ABL878_18515, partial [Burkholderiales bacterium]